MLRYQMTHETEHSKHICFKTEEGENRPQSINHIFLLATHWMEKHTCATFFNTFILNVSD